jgi:8-oxo-dGTP diphosphatase
MIQVVAAIIEREGRVLICQRKPGQSHALEWEFPGGKTEPGEAPPEALCRELEEELGIRGARGEEIMRYQYTYPGRDPILLIFYRVTAFTGEPRNLIFQEMRWEEPENLPGFDFVRGDRDFIRIFSGKTGRASILGRMVTPIKMADPAENEFLASLESRSKRANYFYRTMARRPEILKAFVPLYAAVAGPGSVDRRIKELVYLTCSYANECAYCTATHTASGKKSGITEEELQALQTEQDHNFSELERSVIQYARELTRDADVEPETRDAVFQHFNDEQVVEITLVAAMANFTNRFNNGLSLKPEE